MWCVWDSRNTYEWFAHPETAADLIREGIVIDGERCQVYKIDEYPGINAWQIRAQRAFLNEWVAA